MATAAPTTTPAPQTLPASWRPTAPGCLRSTDYWIWEYETKSDARTVLGGPSQTTDCLAPTWKSDEAYAGSQCPPNYTPACSADAVTCCPTVYDFSCVSNVQPTRHTEMFRCVSAWDRVDETAVITLTKFQENRIGWITRSLQSNQHLFAIALVYTTPTAISASEASQSEPTTTAAATSSSSPSSSTPTSEPAGGTSISGGVAAGIGVGAAAGVLIIALLVGWLFWRRWKRSRQQPPAELGSAGPPPMHQTAHTYSPYDGSLAATATAHYAAGPPSELPTHRDPGELLGTTPDSATTATMKTTPPPPLHHGYVGELPGKGYT